MQYSKPFLIVSFLCLALFVTFLVGSHGSLGRQVHESTSGDPQRTLQLSPIFACGDCLFDEVAFSGPKTTWAVGYDGHDSRKIYSSNDAGQTWEGRTIET